MSRISKQQSSSDEPKKTRRQRRSEMSPEKREFLRNFVGMYDIKTAADLQDAVKDLLGDTIKDMLEEEMNEHLGYEKYKHSDNPDSRNGYKSKEIMSSAGSITIDVPQDRDSAEGYQRHRAEDNRHVRTRNDDTQYFRHYHGYIRL